MLREGGEAEFRRQNSPSSDLITKLHTMRPIRTFNVTPALPQRLEPLRKLAYNLYWDWDFETTDLFR